MMLVIRHIDEIRNKLHQLRLEKGQNVKIGFVPTMGYLHEGHMSLVDRAREECDMVVLSIFVNPLQFGPKEDLAAYPRDMQRDIHIAKQHHIDIIFAPEVEEMYPRPIKTKISVSELSNNLCGASRPYHFDGVCTVVMKLLQIVQPHRAYFGLKDAQQIAVIQKMVYDLNINIDIVPCEILRESDGLAMSSRNVYLSENEREQAVVLSQAIQMAKRLVQERKGLTVEQLLNQTLEYVRQSKMAAVDYVKVLSYPSLDEIGSNDAVLEVLNQDSLILALAVKFGKTRLIDNYIFVQETQEVF
jgi:pantoate--beta-alanine ligase